MKIMSRFWFPCGINLCWSWPIYGQVSSPYQNIFFPNVFFTKRPFFSLENSKKVGSSESDMNVSSVTLVSPKSKASPWDFPKVLSQLLVLGLDEFIICINLQMNMWNEQVLNTKSMSSVVALFCLPVSFLCLSFVWLY